MCPARGLTHMDPVGLEEELGLGRAWSRGGSGLTWVLTGSLGPLCGEQTKVGARCGVGPGGLGSSGFGWSAWRPVAATDREEQGVNPETRRSALDVAVGLERHQPLPWP